MKTSNIGITLIKEFESLHDGDLKTIGLQPKMDPAGIWTEGFGHAIRDNKGNFIKYNVNKHLAYKYSKIKTVREAELVLACDLEAREQTVMQKIKVPLNQNQFDALVSYVYNTGGSSTLYNLINRKASKDEITKWWTEHYITSGGVVYNGLIRRRKAENNLYFIPI